MTSFSPKPEREDRRSPEIEEPIDFELLEAEIRRDEAPFGQEWKFQEEVDRLRRAHSKNGTNNQEDNPNEDKE